MDNKLTEKKQTFLYPKHLYCVKAKSMKSRIHLLLLISNILLYFNTLIESNNFVDEVKQIEKEVEAIEPVENVKKAEEVKEHLNQFYNDVCTSAEDLTYRSYLTPNVRVNIDGKRVSTTLIHFLLYFANCNMEIGQSETCKKMVSNNRLKHNLYRNFLEK